MGSTGILRNGKFTGVGATEAADTQVVLVIDGKLLLNFFLIFVTSRTHI